MMTFKALAAALAVSLLGVSAAHAVTGVEITASGTWDSDAPTTAISAPGDTWSLSFLEPNPLNSDPGALAGQGWSTTFAQDFSYSLNGVPTTSVFTEAVFYDAGNGGGVDISFNSSADTLSLYSNTSTAYADENTGAFIAQPFSDPVAVSYNDQVDNLPSDGSGTVSIASESFTPTNPNTPVGSTPEPETWALMMLGIGLAGAVMRWRPAATAA